MPNSKVIPVHPSITPSRQTKPEMRTLRAISRMTLNRAGFGLVNSSRLRVIERQRIISDGICPHIRHPLNFGEITRNVGFASTTYSLCGLIPMLLGNALLLFRIGIEERMLVEEFGRDYKEYVKRTKKLVLYVY